MKKLSFCHKHISSSSFQPNKIEKRIGLDAKFQIFAMENEQKNVFTSLPLRMSRLIVGQGHFSDGANQGNL